MNEHHPQRNFTALATLAMISAALLLTSFVTPEKAQALPVSRAPNGAGPPHVQYWRMGFTIQPSPVYAALSGRVASVAAEMQSDKGANVYFVFPSVSGRRFVREASFYILNRTGSYGGSAAMTLEVYDYTGALQHVVSASSVDLQTAPVNTWTKVALSGTVADCLVEPGEFLAFHFALSGAPGGDLDLRPVFDVAVGPLQIYLPLVFQH